MIEPVLSEKQENTQTIDDKKSSIELKSLSIDSNKLKMKDLRNDLSNAIELSLKDATCMKLLMWINTFLKINSKNESIKSQNLNNNTDKKEDDDDESLLDRLPLNENLLSFLEELTPFQELHAPSDKFVAGNKIFCDCCFVHIMRNRVMVDITL